MPYIEKMGLSYLALILFCIANLAHASCSKTIVVNQASWKPYMYTDLSGKHAGLDHELVKHILTLAGCDFEFVEFPSRRALFELEKGRIDMVAGASITPEREVYGRFTTSYRDETMVIFIRRQNQGHFPAVNLEQMLDTHQIIMGAVIGAYYGEQFSRLNQKKLTQNNQLILMKNNKNLLSLLSLNRIDAAVGDKISLSVMANEMGIGEDFAIHDLILNQDFVHFLLSKRSTTIEDLHSINKAIEVFTQSDEYTNLLSRYGLQRNRGQNREELKLGDDALGYIYSPAHHTGSSIGSF
ncbi:MAG: transporter substrate-binding domain-containing protein [Pseudomonadales bacterium]|nr:transporter substrate-binding domain-containing protein [Pseudomonadales bacterium]